MHTQLQPMSFTVIIVVSLNLGYQLQLCYGCVISVQLLWGPTSSLVFLHCIFNPPRRRFMPALGKPRHQVPPALPVELPFHCNFNPARADCSAALHRHSPLHLQPEHNEFGIGNLCPVTKRIKLQSHHQIHQHYVVHAVAPTQFLLRLLSQNVDHGW